MDEDALYRIMVPQPLPLSWGRTVQPYNPSFSLLSKVCSQVACLQVRLSSISSFCVRTCIWGLGVNQTLVWLLLVTK